MGSADPKDERHSESARTSISVGRTTSAARERVNRQFYRTLYRVMGALMAIVRSRRSWFVPVLGLTLSTYGSAFAQESQVPPPPPVAATPEPSASAPPADGPPAVAAFPDVEQPSGDAAPAGEPGEATGEATEETPAEAPPEAPAEAPAEVEAPPPPPPVVEEPGPAPALPPEAVLPPRKRRERQESVVRLYVGGAGVFALGTSTTHQWAATCPSASFAGETVAAECTVQSPIGGALEGQLGIRGKYIGAEGFLFGAADYSYARLSFGDLIELPKFGDGTQIGRAGAGAGASIRGFYDPGNIGVTGAVGVGVIGRGIFTNLNLADGSFEQYFASMIRFDLALSLLKFIQLGVYGWVEFAPDVTIRPDLSSLGIPPEIGTVLEDITLFRGTQVFIGPYIGFRTP
jgi:hypothetical protein